MQTEDFEFEENILRNPFSLRNWWIYVEAKKSQLVSLPSTTPKQTILSLQKSINLIYERALKEIPGSYKLWYNYLLDRMAQLKDKCPNDPAFEALNNTFERSLIYMNKMPKIWEEYCTFLVKQRKITKTRKALDSALCALPITQHDRIWKIYLDFIRQPYIPPETAVRVYRRYLKLNPTDAEDFIEYLVSVDYSEEAANELIKLLNREDFVSTKNRTKHDLWMELCDIVSKNPKSALKGNLRIDAIIRQGIKTFSQEVGQLWCALADFYIRSRHFEKARDVFEEAMQSVTTVRDFTTIFDAYSQFEEAFVTAKMEASEKKKKKKNNKGKKNNKENGNEERNGDGDDDDDDGREDEEEGEFTLDDELEMCIARLENLMERRPELFNSVLLRQNPHNVNEWYRRTRLFRRDPVKAVKTFNEALQTIDPFKAVGKLNAFWVNFAKFYEKGGDLESARKIFEKAVLVNFRGIDSLALVWCEYAEMELRHENYDEAIRILQRATTPPPAAPAPAKGTKKTIYASEQEESAQAKVHRSVRLWTMFADLEESLGTLASTKAVYDRMIELRVATPQIILNYATFLEEHKFFEEAFKAYERGVGLFSFPQVYPIWTTYLTKFVARYGGRKLERARDLFEQALDKATPEFSKNILLFYAKLEEDYGLARRAMDVYERATKTVEGDEEKFEIFLIYISRAAEFFGVTKTREIYERAIQTLQDHKYVREMCLRYAELEKKLGEIDRARAIYIHAAQISDPRVQESFWKIFYDFEVHHGNEETFKEMRRIKRSVEATLGTSINLMAASMIEEQQKADSNAAQQKAARRAEREAAANEMQMLEKQKTSSSVVSAENPEELDIELSDSNSDNNNNNNNNKSKRNNNPEELEIEEEEEEDIGIESVQVPDSVFGKRLREKQVVEKGTESDNKKKRF